MNLYSSLVDQIAEEDYAVFPDFLPPDLIRSLREELTNLFDKGEFRNAGVGKGSNFQVRPEIRRDKVLWLDPDDLTPLQMEYWNKVDELRKLFNQEFFLGLKSFEAHFTKYPPGAFYKRHIDQFQQVSFRIISCILYLNPDWEESYGGQLRIYKATEEGEKIIDVVPMAGTLVCFKSADIPHEVLPTEKERYSITGWMKNIL